MITQKNLTIVIPAYNEEKSVVTTIKAVKKYLPKSKIILVDDGSTDQTVKKAKSEKTQVIVHKKNKGYGGALKTGFIAAKTPYIGFLDADLTYNPKYFPKMMNLINKHNLDVIWSNRFGGTVNGMPLVRKFGNRVITMIFFLNTFTNIYDCSSGQRIIHKKALEKISFKSLPNDLDFITAMSKRIVSRGLKFKTIPSNYEKREGSSKLGIFKHGYKMVRNILREK